MSSVSSQNESATETSQRVLAVKLIERQGIMRMPDLKRQGINRATLARLVDEGVVRFGEKALTLGVKTYTIDSAPVRIFDPAKSIVDCFQPTTITSAPSEARPPELGSREFWSLEAIR